MALANHDRHPTSISLIPLGLSVLNWAPGSSFDKANIVSLVSTYTGASCFLCLPILLGEGMFDAAVIGATPTAWT